MKASGLFVFFQKYSDLLDFPLKFSATVSLQAATVQSVVIGHTAQMWTVQQCAILLVFSSSPSPLDLATSIEDKADEIRH